MKTKTVLRLSFGSGIFVVLVLTLLVVGAISYRGMVVSSDSDRWVRHTHEVLEILQDLRFALESVESSSRGFVLTGQESYLKSFRASLSSAEQDQTALRNLTLDNLGRQRQFPALERSIALNIQLAERAVSLRGASEFEAAAEAIRGGAVGRTIDEAQGVVREMQAEELELLAVRNRDAKRRLAQIKTILILGTLLGLLSAAAAGWSVQRDSSSRALAEDALFAEKERAQITLASIGDAVACTDISGNITFLNPVAENLTGWSLQQATGRPTTEVLRILDAASHEITLTLMQMVIGQDRTMHLPANSILIRRDGFEIPIEDSVSLIHDREGQTIGAVIVFRDVSAARTLALQMAHLAEHDFLTGLPNRMLLNDRVRQAIAVASRHMKKVAVLFLDLDGFKHINDSLGHPIGDRLLQSIAKRLVDCGRASDTVSRPGGDEFVVLLPEVEQSIDAAAIAKKMLRAVATPHSIDQHDLHISTSIGVSVYPEDGLDAETLIKNADTAMYQAKENGTDSYQFFKPGMHVRAVERQAIEESLRRALERQEFTLHYQPKINLRTGKITGAEALIRWTHPTRGPVPPVQFIPVAEDCGLILPIGNWVLSEACKQARAWQDAGLSLETVSVNVSAKEFRDENFLEGLFAILTETSLDPSCLELELTESVLMKRTESTESILNTLRATGVRLAVDDFGTGYSSLSYLRKFSVDAIKIDQSFIHQITTAPDEATIVAAVIRLGRSLKLRVIAEGVETPEELAFLQAHQCDEAQGYYFSRPVLPEQFAELLKTGIPATVTTVA
jgi:diguanylate cyclase (GGDEF)-like protein/PAS domain S-box-containing protein